MRHALLEKSNGLSRDGVRLAVERGILLRPLRLLIEVGQRRLARGQDAERDRRLACRDRRAAVALVPARLA